MDNNSLLIKLYFYQYPMPSLRYPLPKTPIFYNSTFFPVFYTLFASKTMMCSFLLPQFP